MVARTSMLSRPLDEKPSAARQNSGLKMLLLKSIPSECRSKISTLASSISPALSKAASCCCAGRWARPRLLTGIALKKVLRAESPSMSALSAQSELISSQLSITRSAISVQKDCSVDSNPTHPYISKDFCRSATYFRLVCLQIGNMHPAGFLLSGENALFPDVGQD